MSRTPEDTISRGLPGETVQAAPRTRREARERYRGNERRQARGLPSTSTGARSLRQAAKPGASLGAGYLGLGAAVLAAIEAVAGIAFFLVRAPELTDPWLPAAAWALYVVAAIAVGLSLMTYGERLTGTAFALICVVLACVVTLDFVGIHPEHDLAGTASASVAAGFALLPVATLRPAREVAGAIVVLGAAFVAMALVSTPITSDTLPGLVSMLALVVVPPSIALFVVHRFRQLVQRELDRVLVQSNVQAPQFAVGMLASDELARLDLAAEKLLDAVANGTDPLPLSDASSSVAASLATELRLHLIEGRRETWLYHAITESDQLGRSVTVTDPQSLAGHLSPAQRDGLLQALWQMVGDGRTSQPGSPVVSVTLGPIGSDGHPVTDERMDVPVVFESRGVPRRRLGPTAWSALQRIGPYTDSVRDGVLHVVAHCVVDRHPTM
ncbi:MULTISPECIES: hypothetical protein [unclassified Curtobacterium]|uniref:hypothetical protein n=1 Tax=unclassified Curtobacterium TaxID=257496 RepID=UPI0009F33360|nr:MULTISPECIES: hypothetical protein [unclassified Curtobacterium]WIA95476.1 hypothetical protein QOL16_10045 [Curtobacterium sp. MCBA15_004]WIA98842.1 hypothetical protein QOL15_09780 [Curtobacterium sp. MCBA15_012]